MYELKEIVYCKFKGDSLKANVKVQGDDFAYKLKGKIHIKKLSAPLLTFVITFTAKSTKWKSNLYSQ